MNKELKPIPKKVKLLAYQLIGISNEINVEEQRSGGIASVSNDGYSVSYKGTDAVLRTINSRSSNLILNTIPEYLYRGSDK